MVFFGVAVIGADSAGNAGIENGTVKEQIGGFDFHFALCFFQFRSVGNKGIAFFGTAGVIGFFLFVGQFIILIAMVSGLIIDGIGVAGNRVGRGHEQFAERIVFYGTADQHGHIQRTALLCVVKVAVGVGRFHGGAEKLVGSGVHLLHKGVDGRFGLLHIFHGGVFFGCGIDQCLTEVFRHHIGGVVIAAQIHGVEHIRQFDGLPFLQPQIGRVGIVEYGFFGNGEFLRSVLKLQRRDNGEEFVEIAGGR